MPEQITLEEALKLVTFKQNADGIWTVKDVHSDVLGSALGSVLGSVLGNVDGNVWGTINGRKWQFIETPREKLQRLIKETGNQELIEAFNQLENN